MSDGPVAKAARQIGAILAELERETGDYVTGIEIESLDVSTCAHHEHLRRVVIETRPKPGTRWEGQGGGDER